MIQVVCKVECHCLDIDHNELKSDDDILWPADADVSDLCIYL